MSTQWLIDQVALARALGETVNELGLTRDEQKARFLFLMDSSRRQIVLGEGL